MIQVPLEYLPQFGEFAHVDKHLLQFLNLFPDHDLNSHMSAFRDKLLIATHALAQSDVKASELFEAVQIVSRGNIDPENSGYCWRQALALHDLVQRAETDAKDIGAKITQAGQGNDKGALVPGKIKLDLAVSLYHMIHSSDNFFELLDTRLEPLLEGLFGSDALRLAPSGIVSAVAAAAKTGYP